MSELNPGREMDAKVAEKMGIKIYRADNASSQDLDIYWIGVGGGFVPVPNWSTSPDAALGIVMSRKLSLIPVKEGWFCGKFDLEDEFFDTEHGIIDGHFDNKSYAVAFDLAHAVCKAFLSMRLDK